MAKLKLKGFQLEGYISTAIKKVVDAYLLANPPLSAIYLDYQPSEMQIDANDSDFVTAIYAQGINFIPGEGSNTGKQTARNQFFVDCYGFGDPLKDGSDKWESTVKEAQNRAEILTSLVYHTIQDRTQELEQYESGIEWTEKEPVSVQKAESIGATKSHRGICVYRFIFTIKIEEDPPQEALGAPYEGSSNDSPTYNPGGETSE